MSLVGLYMDWNKLTGAFLGWSVPTDHLNLTDVLPPSPPGNIPASLGNLQNLQELDLQHNQLAGANFYFFVVVSAH